jgi:hypothetical protein
MKVSHVDGVRPGQRSQVSKRVGTPDRIKARSDCTRSNAVIVVNMAKDLVTLLFQQRSFVFKYTVLATRLPIVVVHAQDSADTTTGRGFRIAF